MVASLRWAEGTGTEMTKDVGPGGSTWAGGRRVRQAGGRHRRMKVRLSEAELVELVRRAAGVSPQRYLCEVALGDGPPTVSERRRAVVELGALGRQLVGLAAHVGQLAAAADTTGRAPAGTDQALAGVEQLAGPLTQAVESVTTGVKLFGAGTAGLGGGIITGAGIAGGNSSGGSKKSSGGSGSNSSNQLANFYNAILQQEQLGNFYSSILAQESSASSC